MMKLDRIDFISDGFRQILASDGVGNLVAETAESIANEAGEGFVATSFHGRNDGRWLGYVRPTDKKSSVEASENQAMERAISS